MLVLGLRVVVAKGDMLVHVLIAYRLLLASCLGVLALHVRECTCCHHLSLLCSTVSRFFLNDNIQTSLGPYRGCWIYVGGCILGLKRMRVVLAFHFFPGHKDTVVSTGRRLLEIVGVQLCHVLPCLFVF